MAPNGTPGEIDALRCSEPGGGQSVAKSVALVEATVFDKAQAEVKFPKYICEEVSV